MSEHEIVTSGDEDLEISREIAVTVNEGRVQLLPSNFRQVLVIAKTLSMSDVCVPPAFRGNRGACLQVTLDALRVGASPFALINQAYVTKDKAGQERVAYQAQAIHAIVNGSKILQCRLRPSFDGEGVERRCTVVGWVVGEDEPFTYESPSIRQILVKNSPLWISDPDQQLSYYSTRAWARRYVPEVILGMFTPDDLGADPVDVTPPPDVSNFFPPPNRADQDEVIGHNPNGHAAVAIEANGQDRETPVLAQAAEVQADRHEAAAMANQAVTRPPDSEPDDHIEQSPQEWLSMPPTADIRADRDETVSHGDDEFRKQLTTRPPDPPSGEQMPAGPAPKRRTIPHRRTKEEKARDEAAGISDLQARIRWREQHGYANPSHRAAAATSGSSQPLPRGANDPPSRAADKPENDPVAPVEQDSASFDMQPEARIPTHALPPWVDNWWETAARTNHFALWMDQRSCATEGRDQLIALALGAKSTVNLTQLEAANNLNIKAIAAVSKSAADDVIAAIARRREELQRQR